MRSRNPLRPLALPSLAVTAGTAALFVMGAVAAQVQPPGRPGAAGARPEQLLRLLDQNRDGRLDRTEFQGLSRIAPRFRQDPQAAGRLFDGLDRDQDGVLNFEELGALARLGTPPAPAAGPTVRPVVPEREPSAQDLQFFEQKIRPVLAQQCYSCHSAEVGKPAGGFLADSRAGLQRGGDRGAAVVPGNPDTSLLIRALRYTDSRLKMPPPKDGGQLPASVVADFERWVKLGAPWPKEAAPLNKVGKGAVGTRPANREWDTDKARQHWSFQPPRKIAPPAVKDTRWPRSDVDRFVLAELEAHRLKPVSDADPRTLIRRVSFDLTGLPPTPEEVDAFVRECTTERGQEPGAGGQGKKNRAAGAPPRRHPGGARGARPDAQLPSPKAFARLVDRLLASPHFGERWGRHWLDVARYAESSGKEVNIAYPHAWRYRDYVIEAFNSDKPYDRFLKEQVAGDLLPYNDETQHAQQLIATGYLALVPKSHNTRDPRQFALDLADDQIDSLTQGTMGLTVACARCHDHKFDPISQKDYYALAGIFLSTESRYGTPRSVQNARATPLIPLPASARVTPAPSLPLAQLTQLRQRYEQTLAERNEIQAAARRSGSAPMADPRLLRTIIVGSTLEKLLERYDESGRQQQLAVGLQEGYAPRDASVLQRGELDKPLETVPRGFLQVLAARQPAIRQGSGRKELSDWISSSDNPLTARVMANRVWLHLFGRGIVASPDNFGVMGQKPSHPALLDHLAVSFVEEGWSVKKLVRKIVLSRAYQLSSSHNAADYAADPDNTYLWRMSRRPLEAEAIRDTMLVVSGRMDLTPPVGSPIANVEGPVQQRAMLGLSAPGTVGGQPMFGGPGRPGAPGGFGGFRRPGRPGGPGGPGGQGAMVPEEPVYRSVYLSIVRDQVPEALATFDFAGPSLVTGSRETTTVPSQALYLLNNASVQRLADAMALRLEQQTADPAERTRLAFQWTFSRLPTPAEVAAARRFQEQFTAAEAGRTRSKEALERAALSAFCQALFASAEFRYLD